MRVLLVCALMGALAGCGKEDTEQGQTYAGQEDGEKITGLTSLLQKTGNFCRYCTTEEGAYYLTEEETELTDGSYAPRLMYMDYATCQEVYLCSDSSCRHNTEDCTAVLTGAASDGRIFVWNGALYFLNRSMDTSGTTIVDLLGNSAASAAEAEQAELYRMNLDGSGRERIYQFKPGVTVEDVVQGDEEGLYFVTKKLDASEKEDGTYMTASDRQLICFNPDSGNAETVASLDFGDGVNWEVIGVAAEQVVLEAYQYPDGMTEEEVAAMDEDRYQNLLKNSQLVYATLDLSHGGKQQFYTQPARDSSVSRAVLNDCLYTSSDAGGNIVKVDIATGAESVLCDLENNYILGTLGNLLCCTSQDMTEDYGYYLVNTETGEMTYCSLTNVSLGWNLDLLAMAGDQALVVYDYEFIPLGEETYDITRYQYGLISLEDLLNSRPNYTPIAMVGKGI